MTNTNPSRKPARRARVSKVDPKTLSSAGLAAAVAQAAEADAAQAAEVAQAAAEAAAEAAEALTIGADSIPEAELPPAVLAAMRAAEAQVADAVASRAKAPKAPRVPLTTAQADALAACGWDAPRLEQHPPIVSSRPASRINYGSRNARFNVAALTIAAAGCHVADLAALWLACGQGDKAPALSTVLGFIARQTGRPVLRYGADISLG